MKVGTFLGHTHSYFAPFSSFPAFSSFSCSQPPIAHPDRPPTPRTADSHPVPPPLKVFAGALSTRFLDESQLEGNHLVVKCAINNEIDSHALIDCGAMGFAFIDEQFVSHHNLPQHRLRVPCTLQVINGRPVSSGDIIKLTYIPLDVGGHREVITAFVTSLGQYPLVLEIP